MARRKPLAFMSYTRFDDDNDKGRLTEIRNRLSAEVQAHTGAEFPIFQDRNDIQWGQNWRERLNESLDEVTFLIAFITPSFFNSKACRSELRKFLEREKTLQRKDLILPIYYIESSLVQDKAKRAKDNLAQMIATRQYFDWRNLRFSTLDSVKFRVATVQLSRR